MNILLVQTGFLGDVILSTPVIRAVQEIYPAAKISFLTTPAAQELIAFHPLVVETLVFDKRRSQSGWGGLRAMAAELRRRRFDMVFSLHKSSRTALLLWLARIPLRYGFQEASLKFLSTKTAPRADLSHDVLRNLAILRNVGKEPSETTAALEVHIPPESIAEAERLLERFQGREIISIAPGSVWLTKRWTEDGFRSVAAEFLQRGSAVVLIGGPSDVEVAEIVAKGLGDRVLNLVGKCSMLTSAAVISKSSLLITNDSAPLHLGSTFHVPTVAIFCATITDFGFGPWKNAHEICEVNGLECRPCGRHGGQHCPTGTHACRRGVTPQAVLAACERLLRGSAL